MSKKINLKSLSRDETLAFFRKLDLPRYRSDQLIHWIYEKHASAIDEITEFSKSLRQKLNKCAYISSLIIIEKFESSEGTEKYVFALEDGQMIESVLIDEKDRLTLCVSSQVGCAYGCRFCQTGMSGFIRNLRSYEIVDQIIAVQKDIKPDRKITHVVLMGMGEPLANFGEVIEALWKIVSCNNISKRKITLSTAGIISKLIPLAEQGPGVNLAISLNASTDVTRSSIMPINRKYPLASLLRVCKQFPLPPRKRLTFEYILIDGLNDSLHDAERLVKILKGIRCKINLIPLNPVEGSRLSRPLEDKIVAFQTVLMKNNLTALIRKGRGSDIQAACGQLRSAPYLKTRED